MDSESSQNLGGSGELEADSLEVGSSGGDTLDKLECAIDALIRIELDISCTFEKLVNLELLVMHVASRENDFEAFCCEEDDTLTVGLGDTIVKAFEYDILYGILESEVRQVESFVYDNIQTDIVSFSFMHLGDDIYTDMEDRLQDCEYYLKQSLEQISNIKTQSANFRRILLASSQQLRKKDGKELVDASENLRGPSEQKNILRMLEKSLDRELDLEKKLAESMEAEQDLKHKVFSIEQETQNMRARLFEAENNAENLLRVSKDLINTEIQNRAECKLLRDSNMELNNELRGAVNRVEVLEKQLKESAHRIKDMEKLIEELKSNVSSKCEMNAQLIQEINYLDETKKQTAKDIKLRTKLMTDLVLQLGVERARLQYEISSLALALANHKNIARRMNKPKNEMRDDVETVRNIDAKHLQLKYVIIIMFLLLFSAAFFFEL